MLSISPPMQGAGKQEYYLNLAREDYYLEGGEPPGRWHGEGAKELGLEGEVDKENFRHVYGGYSPDGERKLVQNAGKEDRQNGWDLTFSAPKSVSTAWSQSSGEERQAFQASHREAVQKALTYIESEAGITRRGSGGGEKEPAGLVFATFEHGTSRAQDPQLHTHALVLNVSTREDGTTGAIESKKIFQTKMAAGALYRAELAAQIEQRLGLEAERKDSSFELKGVSKELIQEFSKRRKEIEEALGAKGFESAQAAKIAALDTRSAKEHEPRETLFLRWQTTGKERGFGPEELEKLYSKQGIPRSPEQEKKAAIGGAIEIITAHSSHFSERDLVRFTAVEAQGKGLACSEYGREFGAKRC